MSDQNFFNTLSPPVTPTDPIQPGQAFSWQLDFDLPMDLPALDTAHMSTDAGSPVPALEFPPPPSPEFSPMAAPVTAADQEPLPALSLDDIPAMDWMDLDRPGLANVMPMAFDFTFSFGLPSPPPSFYEGIPAPESPLSLATAVPSAFFFGTDSNDLVATPEPEPMPQVFAAAEEVNEGGLHRHARRGAQDLDDQDECQQVANQGDDRRKRQRVSRPQAARSVSPSSSSRARIRQSTPQSAARTTVAQTSAAGITSPPLTPPMVASSSSSTLATTQHQQPPMASTTATFAVNGLGLESLPPSSAGEHVDVPSSSEGEQQLPQDDMHVDPPVPQVPVQQLPVAPIVAAPAVMLGLPAPIGAGHNMALLQQPAVGVGVGFAFAPIPQDAVIPTTDGHAQAHAPDVQRQDQQAGDMDAMAVVHDGHQQQVPLHDNHHQLAAPPIFAHVQHQQHQVLAHTTTEQHMHVHESVDTDAVAEQAHAHQRLRAQVEAQQDIECEDDAMDQGNDDMQHQQQQALQGDMQSLYALSQAHAATAGVPAQSVSARTTTEQHQSTEANHSDVAVLRISSPLTSQSSSLATPRTTPTPIQQSAAPRFVTTPTSPSRHQRPRPPAVLAAHAAASSSAIQFSPAARMHQHARATLTSSGVPAQRVVPTASGPARVLVAEYERERHECARDEQNRQRQAQMRAGRDSDREVDVGRGQQGQGQGQGQGYQQEPPRQDAQGVHARAYEPPVVQQQQQGGMADAVGRRASDPRDRGGVPTLSAARHAPQLRPAMPSSVHLASHAPSVRSAFARARAPAVPVSPASPVSVAARPMSTRTVHAYLPSPRSSPEPDEVQLAAVSVQLSTSSSVVVEVVPAAPVHLVANVVALRRRAASLEPVDDQNARQAQEEVAAAQVGTPPPSPVAVAANVNVDDVLVAPMTALHQAESARPPSPVPLRPQVSPTFAHAVDVVNVSSANAGQVSLSSLPVPVTRTTTTTTTTTTTRSTTPATQRICTQARVVLSSLLAIISLALVAGSPPEQVSVATTKSKSKPCTLPSAHVLATCAVSAPALPSSAAAIALASTSLAALQVMLSPAVAALIRTLHHVLVRVLVPALVLAGVAAVVYVAVKWVTKVAAECYDAYVQEQERVRREGVQRQQAANVSWYHWLVELADSCDRPEPEAASDCCPLTAGASYLASWLSGLSPSPCASTPTPLPIRRRECESGCRAPAACRASLPNWFTSTRREAGRWRA